jgi:prolipoprotein diacylglyceryltransferase
VSFPVIVPLGPLRLDAHVILDAIAYFTGFRLYLRARRRTGDALDAEARWWIVAAAIGGAAIGSKVLFWFEDPVESLAHLHDPGFFIAGKTVIGGLIGGWIAVELTKKGLGITRRTGDLFAVPLAVAMAIGRIGCFLGGLPDRTYGVATSLPWGVDFGDGVSRHPTQLYEALLLAGLALVLSRLARQPHREGDLFKVFMVVYMSMRLAVDAMKPEVRVFLGLSSLQWTALAVVIWYADDVRRWLSNRLWLRQDPNHPPEARRAGNS